MVTTEAQLGAGFFVQGRRQRVQLCTPPLFLQAKYVITGQTRGLLGMIVQDAQGCPTRGMCAGVDGAPGPRQYLTKQAGSLLRHFELVGRWGFCFGVTQVPVHSPPRLPQNIARRSLIDFIFIDNGVACFHLD